MSRASLCWNETYFDSHTWGTVVTPTNIVAVVAGVGVLALHPLLFVPILATTFGAAHVVSHVHELLAEEYTLWKNGNEETGTTTETNGLDKEQAQAHSVETETSPLDTVTKETALQPTSLETVMSADDDYSDWVATNFSALNDEILVDQQFQGLNALEFFQVFLGDDAPFSFQEFQRKRGDVDIDYGKWTAPTSGSSSDVPFTKLQRLERDISFKTRTKSFFGPPFAVCHKHQQVYLHKRFLILQCHVRLEGIPFCDCFSVLERWILEAPKKSSGNKVATLTVHSQVYFSKPCAFESQIRSKSQETLVDVVSSWCAMAQQALQITIQQKLEREQREASMPMTGDFLDSIEVTHSESSGKSIVMLDDENVPPVDIVGVPIAQQPVLSRKQPLQHWKRSVLTRIAKKNVQ